MLPPVAPFGHVAPLLSISLRSVLINGIPVLVIECKNANKDEANTCFSPPFGRKTRPFTGSTATGSPGAAEFPCRGAGRHRRVRS